MRTSRPLGYRVVKSIVHSDQLFVIRHLALYVGASGMHHSRLPSSKSTLSYRLIAFDFATAFIAPILTLYLRDPALFGSVGSEGIALFVSVGGGVSILFFILVPFGA